MVICCVAGCSKCSGCDSDVRFFRIPAIIWHRDIHDLELSQQRRDGLIAAISRQDLDVNALEKYRICSRHFVSGEPVLASLYDCTNPDWLPMTNLGHSKNLPVTKAVSERYERAQRRNEEQIVKENVFQRTGEEICMEIIHLTVKEEVMEILEGVQLVENSSVKVMEMFVLEFVKSNLAQIVKEEMEAEYVRFAETKCAYATKISSLQDDLAKCYSTIDKLSLNIKQLSIPFGSKEALSSEGALDSGEKVSLFTGLPNFNILKAIYDHVVATIPCN